MVLVPQTVRMVKLGGRGYVFWGGREGYETLLNTDVKFEQENIARLMKMAVEYGRSIGFKGDFYIEPKPKEPMKHQYDFDAATAIGFCLQCNTMYVRSLKEWWFNRWFQL